MLRPALLALIFLVSLSSSSIIKKSLARRQSDAQHCQVIDGFDCKCSYYRVTCTTERNLQTPISIAQNEKQKYQSVELVITATANVEVTENTFEPVKELYKPDGDNFEFRIKFEKFTALHLSSPGIFNRVFPDNLPSGARKHVALEIYNTEVQPNDNVNLFQNLNADSLELYALYPFRGTFQQLFNGANIKYVRLSGGDIRSDLAQPFTGTVGRLELAKQANALSVQNFPVYPAHEMVVSAFYITDYNSEHPPNYDNLAELRVQSPERVPANAFRQFPNLKILSVESEKDIDPHALDGLDNLEKLTIKSPNSASTLEILKNLPKVKEFETNIDKLDEQTQCQLIEKLANGQVAVQAIPNGRECTCVSAYLDSATGRAPCDAQHCEHSSCAAIKNNYDGSTRSFKTPPSIRRADGSDALHQRESRTHSGPFQVPQQDQEKLQRGTPQHVQQQQPQPEYDARRPSEGDQDQRQPDHSHHGPDTRPSWEHSPDENNFVHTHDHETPDPNAKTSDVGDIQNERPESPGSNDDTSDVENNQNEKTESGGSNHDTSDVENNQNERPESPGSNDDTSDVENNQNEKVESADTNGHDSHLTEPVLPDWNPERDATTTIVQPNYYDDTHVREGQDGNRDGGESETRNEGEENRQEGDGNENQPNRQGSENQPDGQGGQIDDAAVNPNIEGSTNGTDSATPPPKKGMSWLPIIIIAASIAVLLIAGLIVIFIRKRGNKYERTAGNEPGAAAPARA